MEKIEKTGKMDRNKDLPLAIMILIMGFLFWELSGELDVGVTIFTALLCAVSIWYLHSKGYVMNKRALACLALLVIFSLPFFIFDSSVITALNFIFIIGVYIYWICLYTNKAADVKLSVYMVGDALSQLILVPFSNFGKVFSAFVKGKKTSNFGVIMLSLLAMIPLVAIVMALLISSDVIFESIMDSVISKVFSNISEYLLKILMGIPVAMYIYGLLYGNSTLARDDKKFKSLEYQKELSGKFQVLPKASAATVLTVLNVIYLVYFVTQLAYFTSAFNSILPEGFTYAEYARRGFFQICQISVINLFVIGIISSFAKNSKDRLVRVEIAILAFFTIMFSVTVISKMMLYIKIYGMTQLRVYTTWFTVVLIIIFTIILIRQFVRFNAFKAAVIGFIICFAVLCYGNIDKNIAQYNLQRYEAGTLQQMDETVLPVKNL